MKALFHGEKCFFDEIFLTDLSNSLAAGKMNRMGFDSFVKIEFLPQNVCQNAA